MIIFSKHASEAIQQRSILVDWVARTIAAPDRTEPDSRHPDRTRSYKAIAEFGGRILRVVHQPAGPDILIITVHFDRSAKS